MLLDIRYLDIGHGSPLRDICRRAHARLNETLPAGPFQRLDVFVPKALMAGLEVKRIAPEYVAP